MNNYYCFLIIIIISAEMACQRLDERTIENGFLDSIDYILFDLDGVLWVEGRMIPKAPELVSLLREKGKTLIFLTNDDYVNRQEKLRKFQRLGIEASTDDIFSSAYCAALYVKSLNVSVEKKAYVSGMQGIVDELALQGIESLPIGPDPMPDDPVKWMSDGNFTTEKVSAVVVGFDYYFSYPKLMKAMQYLDDPDVAFVATHLDSRYPLQSGGFQPGANGFVSAVKAVSGRSPVVTGKPSSYALNCIQVVHPDIDVARSLMIGDNLSTDIEFGRKLSMRTLLVLTGVNNLNDVRSRREDPDRQMQVPDFYTESVESFYNLLVSQNISRNDI